MSIPPETYRSFVDAHPQVAAAYQDLGDVVRSNGPLDDRTAQLVKLGLAVGMQHEGAVHAHVRKALDHGWSAEEIRHAVLLAIPTIGFPPTMAALTWVEDELSSGE